MSAISKLSTWTLTTASMLLAVASAHAQVTVDEPWVRATVAQQQATGAFMRLSSKADSALVQADSPAAQHVEIHEMIMENDVMKMRQIPRLALPAGQTVELKPGGQCQPRNLAHLHDIVLHDHFMNLDMLSGR